VYLLSSYFNMIKFSSSSLMMEAVEGFGWILYAKLTSLALFPILNSLVPAAIPSMLS